MNQRNQDFIYTS